MILSVELQKVFFGLKLCQNAQGFPSSDDGQFFQRKLPSREDWLIQ